MEKEKIKPDIEKIGNEIEDTEPIELVLFQVPECYVYIVSASFIHGFVSKFDFDNGI
jgi:hypothetical protein